MGAQSASSEELTPLAFPEVLRSLHGACVDEQNGQRFVIFVLCTSHQPIR